MRFCFALCFLLLLAGNAARAQTETLIEVETGRMTGDGGPVLQRAILTMPAVPTDTALLYFRGNPGYMLTKSLRDKQRNLGWIGKGEAQLMQAGIALVQVDCPTDQWGDSPRPPATKCLGDYRSSQQHADDVRRLMARLKTQHVDGGGFVAQHHADNRHQKRGIKAGQHTIGKIRVAQRHECEHAVTDGERNRHDGGHDAAGHIIAQVLKAYTGQCGKHVRFPPMHYSKVGEAAI